MASAGARGSHVPTPAWQASHAALGPGFGLCGLFICSAKEATGEQLFETLLPPPPFNEEIELELYESV